MRYSELVDYMKDTISEIEEEGKNNPEKTYTPEEVIDIIEEFIHISYDCNRM